MIQSVHLILPSHTQTESFPDWILSLLINGSYPY